MGGRIARRSARIDGHDHANHRVGDRSGRQLRENYPHVPGGLPSEMAWHSGLSDAARKAIHQRLRDNTQRVLITSPESFVGSLSRVLYKTAESGLLKYFVVDEAHLVAQWAMTFGLSSKR